MTTDRHEGPARIDVMHIRLGAGFSNSEREEVLARFSKLNRRLRRFRPDAVDLELSVKGRDTNEQQVILDARIAGFDPFLATSREPVLKDALNDVRDDIWRQIDDALNKRRASRHRAPPPLG
ncbi:MAG: HPF/RaiA family ribosome-associated protein [Actinomycetota bacterium]|nr:HPF/RaiA family ribosome-associated protein [Actinomycetota bacterium]